MSLYIGIDGGGSKTKCVLCDGDLKVYYESYAGPSNFLSLGTEKVSKTILDLIINCCKSRDILVPQIESILLGTTGAGRESDANNLETAVYERASSKNLNLTSFKVVSDARIALEGALSGKPGSILIAGTGSIMFGKDKNGLIHRVGGFGRLIGDEGSGLTIGRKGLNILARYYDGRGQNSLLQEKIKRKFNIKDQNELITSVYSEKIKCQSVAPLVMEAATEGDAQCKDILNQESDELILHILSMQKKLKEETMKVVFIGGTIANDNIYSNMLKEKIKLFLKNIILQQPDFPPEIGAVIMAKHNI